MMMTQMTKARARAKRERGFSILIMWTLFFERIFCFFDLGFVNLGFNTMSLKACIKKG